jgi:hypothetical protein
MTNQSYAPPAKHSVFSARNIYRIAEIKKANSTPILRDFLTFSRAAFSFTVHVTVDRLFFQNFDQHYE